MNPFEGRSIKYLGLCIEKDDEQIIDEDDLIMIRKQMMEGTIHKYYAQELMLY